MKVVLDISPISNPQHSVRGVGSYITSLKNQFDAQKKVEFEYINGIDTPTDADILHIPYFDPFQLTLPKATKQKIIVTIHDLIPLRFPSHFPSGLKGKVKWQIQKRGLRKVDAIITDSKASKKDIIKFAGVPGDKVHVIYLAADKKFRRLPDRNSSTVNLKSKYKFPEEFVLYVGDATWNKNLPDLVRVAESTQIPLYLVGKVIKNKEIDRSNKWNEDLIQVQKMLKDAIYTNALGFVKDEDLVALYNSATLLALPSRYEGFGLPVLEAMQCACPVLTTKEGSLKEIAQDAAFFTQPTEKEIAKNLTKLFSDNTLQNQLSKKGILQAKKFSWIKTASQTIKIYEKVLSR